jgi:hypothetical protein
MKDSGKSASAALNRISNLVQSDRFLIEGEEAGGDFWFDQDGGA